MLIEIQTGQGKRKVRVCDYCRTVCVSWPQRFCSGHCARNYERMQALRAKSAPLSQSAK